MMLFERRKCDLDCEGIFSNPEMIEDLEVSQLAKALLTEIEDTLRQKM